MTVATQLSSALATVLAALAEMEIEARIDALNQVRLALHQASPFVREPVDCVQWVKEEQVSANNYNPNSVAPPEMKLLQISVSEDGYTQPVVGWLQPGGYEVVDGFHRTRVAKEVEVVRARLFGRIPIVAINEGQHDRGDRMAATIRHNRARGKHAVGKMADIVLELKRRNWSDAKVARDLGMDEDEVLRLTQITGLAEAFAGREFSQAWEAQLSTGDTAEQIENQNSLEA